MTEALELTGRFDRDVEIVHGRGVIRRDVDALLRRHERWVDRRARARLNRSPRAQAVESVEDVANTIRLGIWKALLDFRFICSAGCRLRGAAWSCLTRADWDAHVLRSHRAAPVAPANDVGKHVRIMAINEANAELRKHYKLKRIAPRHADQVVPVEAVEHMRRRVLDADRDAKWDATHDVATQESFDLGLQLGELAEEARASLYPAAREMVGRLLEGETVQEVAETAAHYAGPGPAKAAASRAQLFIQSYAERAWGGGQ